MNSLIDPLRPGMKVLDIGSPQWSSLHLARQFPVTQFYYSNIFDSELDPNRDIAKCLGVGNIR